MDWTKVICYLGGGLALFLYGMLLAKDALEKIAGRRLRIILELLTSNRFLGVGVGIFVTACTQSSSATTVMLVSLVNSGLMAFAQTLGVILGANIGTTLTVQIIAFKITDYALLMIALGLLVSLLGRYEKAKSLGLAMMAFGFIFYGMDVMEQGVYPLRESEWFREQVMSFGENPLTGIAVSAAFTAIVQSSAATVAVALALASQGMLGATPDESLRAAVPIIFGANIGTCATALLATIGANVHARRVAVGHLFFNLGGVLLFLPVMGLFTDLVLFVSREFSPDVGIVRLLANAHTVFNVINALVFLAFTGLLARLVERLLPERKERKGVERLSFVDPKILGSAALAIRSASSAVEHMSGAVLTMVRESGRVLRHEDAELLEDVRRRDEQVDFVYRRVSDYLVTVLEGNLSAKERDRCKKQLILASGFEKLGNLVGESLMDAFQNKMARDVEFPIEGQKELEAFHGLVCEFFQAIASMLARDDPSLGKAALQLRDRITAARRTLQEAHHHRLSKGLSDARQSDVHFMEVLYVLDSMTYRATCMLESVIGSTPREA